MTSGISRLLCPNMYAISLFISEFDFLRIAAASRSVLRFVYFPIDRIAFHKFCMRTDAVYPSLFEYEYLIRFLYGRDPLRDNDFGRFGKIVFQSPAYQRLRLRIDRTGRVVQDQNFRFPQQSARNAQTLFLSARKINAAFFEISVVPFGKRSDISVRLRDLAGPFASLAPKPPRRPIAGSP